MEERFLQMLKGSVIYYNMQCLGVDKCVLHSLVE